MAIKPKKINRHWVKEMKPFERYRDFSKFYNARAWRKVSRAFRDKNKFCVDCEAEGIVSESKVTDHIRGLGFLIDNGIDPYDEKELQALCNKCHNKKSGRESRVGKGYGGKNFNNR